MLDIVVQICGCVHFKCVLFITIIIISAQLLFTNLIHLRRKKKYGNGTAPSARTSCLSSRGAWSVASHRATHADDGGHELQTSDQLQVDTKTQQGENHPRRLTRQRLSLLPPPRPSDGQGVLALRQRVREDWFLGAFRTLPGGVSLKRPGLVDQPGACGRAVGETGAVPQSQGGGAREAHGLRQRGDLETIQTQ